jgi:hypothetical protein
LPIIATPNGANRNCPNDPAAVPAPSAIPRRSAEGGQHQIERTAGQSESDQDPGAEIKRQRRRGVAHHDETAGVQNGADTHDAQHTEPVGDRAGNRLAQSPQQILHGKREAEDVAAP